LRCDREACANERGGVNAGRSEPRPYKVTKHALEKQDAFHDFYGVAADADVVDLAGGFAGAHERFAGAERLECLRLARDEDVSRSVMGSPSTYLLTAGDLQAEFWPAAGMLGASLRFRGVELLRRVDDLDAARSKGSTAGIPLLYPWANRLGSLQYRAAGRQASLDSSSVLLHFDDHKLPMHGVPWSQLPWTVISSQPDALTARLDWLSQELLAIFPFPHRVEMAVRLRALDLEIQTTVFADSGSAVPISFGFHPYFGIPGIPRTEWTLNAPAMRRLALDAQGVPTGAETASKPLTGRLGNTSYDDGFALSGERATFSIEGNGYSIAVEFESGFHFAQIFAPKDKEFIAIEPMTAETNALCSGEGLRVIAAGEQFTASFRIVVSHHA
jgi:aldose 1-epimerase